MCVLWKWISGWKSPCGDGGEDADEVGWSAVLSGGFRVLEAGWSSIMVGRAAYTYSFEDAWSIDVMLTSDGSDEPSVTLKFSMENNGMRSDSPRRCVAKICNE